MWGCAPQELPQPLQPPVDVSKRLAAMEECIARSQGAVNAAAATGIPAEHVILAGTIGLGVYDHRGIDHRRVVV